MKCVWLQLKAQLIVPAHVTVMTGEGGRGDGDPRIEYREMRNETWFVGRYKIIYCFLNDLSIN